MTQIYPLFESKKINGEAKKKPEFLKLGLKNDTDSGYESSNRMHVDTVIVTDDADLYKNCDEYESNTLISKENLNRVVEIKKPECGSPGFKTNDSDESEYNETCKLTISDSPNSYKNYGELMSEKENGFVKFPRSVLSDPRYKGARLKYQKVLHIIFENVVFRKTPYAIGTKLIKVDVGQFCVSQRKLMEICNEYVKYEEDLLDRSTIRRAIDYWTSCQFVTHNSTQGKTVLTVTLPEFYISQNTQFDPGLDHKPTHDRPTKEEREEREEEYISNDANAKFVANAPENKKIPSRKRKKVEKEPLIERDKNVFTSDSSHKKLLESRGSEDVVKKIYSEISIWKSEKGISGGSDYKTADNWNLKTHNYVQKSFSPSQKKLNHDTSPSHPSKKLIWD